MFEQGTLINLYSHASGDARQQRETGLLHSMLSGDMIKQHWITIIIIEAKFSKIQSNEKF